MEKELRIVLSLEMAKKWYKSEDTELKTLALTVYSKEELETTTFNEIFDSVGKEAYTEYVKRGNAYRNVLMTADYLNKGWTKRDNEIGYYWSYDYDSNEWILRNHNSVSYTNIIYYKTKEIANTALALMEEEYNLFK